MNKEIAYCLKTGLSKSAVYRVVSEFIKCDIVLAPESEISFNEPANGFYEMFFGIFGKVSILHTVW